MIETNRADRQNGVQAIGSSTTSRRHEYERYVLWYTSCEDGAVSLTDLSTDLVSWEETVLGVENRAKRLDSVRIKLFHKHVPRLTDDGVVDWYREDGTIYVERTADE